MNAIQLRCPIGPRRLFAILREEGEPMVIVSGNLVEFKCRDCCKELRRHRPEVDEVFHRFNFVGELVETVVVQDKRVSS